MTKERKLDFLYNSEHQYDRSVQNSTDTTYFATPVDKYYMPYLFTRYRKEI
jgi:hypothetical protein